jgi:predicted O-methyltransferase YrrM
MNKTDYFSWLNEYQDADERLKKLRQYADLNRVPIIQAEGIVFLKHLIQLKNCRHILEIGSAIGYSAINMALMDPYIQITTIERDPVMISEARKNIHLFNLENQIHLIEGDALELDETTLNMEYDLLFIDAAKSQYQKFFEKYTPYLKPDGIIVTDNLIFHDMVFEEHIENRGTRQLVNKIKHYNEWLRNNPRYHTYFYSIGDGIAVSIKK